MEIATSRSFRTSPKNVAVERDFNHVDAHGIASDAIEQAWAPLEQEFAKATKNVVETQAFPEERDYNFILNFLCLFAVRNPALRDSLNQAREHALHIAAELLVSDPQIYKRHVQELTNNREKASNASYAEMKLFVRQGFYSNERLNGKWMTSRSSAWVHGPSPQAWGNPGISAFQPSFRGPPSHLRITRRQAS